MTSSSVLWAARGQSEFDRSSCHCFFSWPLSPGDDMAHAIPGSDPILKHVAKLVLSAKLPKRCCETSKASPSTKYCPTSDREAFNHKIWDFRSNPQAISSRSGMMPVSGPCMEATGSDTKKNFRSNPQGTPQMRPHHRVQPLTNPPGHAQEPHEQYRCKTAGNNKTYCNPPTACNRNYTCK